MLLRRGILRRGRRQRVKLDMIIILELLVPNVAETQLVKHEGTRWQRTNAVPLARVIVGYAAFPYVDTRQLPSIVIVEPDEGRPNR